MANTSTIRFKSAVASTREVFASLISVRMSRIAFHLDYYCYPPVIIVCLALAARNISLLATATIFLVGLAGWTLAEYVLHRFALHHWPYVSRFHLAHHEEPRAMIGSPTLPTLGFFTLIALVPAWLAVGRAPALAWFAGFLAGYTAFAAIHELVHHSDDQSALLRHFKRLHALHHHGDSDRNFGVTTAFWDKVFGTYADKPRRKGAAQRS